MVLSFSIPSFSFMTECVDKRFGSGTFSKNCIIIRRKCNQKCLDSVKRLKKEEKICEQPQLRAGPLGWEAIWEQELWVQQLEEVPHLNKYGRSKSSTGGGSHGETKTLELTGEIQPRHVVTVKELAYRETTHRDCDMKLSANKKIDVPYYVNCNYEQYKTIKMHKLIEYLSKADNDFKNEGNRVIFHLDGRCKFTCVKRALRFSEADLNPQRLRRIKPPQTDQHNSGRTDDKYDDDDDDMI